MTVRACRSMVLLLGVALVVPAANATAQGYDPGFFAGGAAVWANVAGQRYGVVIDEDAWGYQAFVGMDVLPYLGVEVARTDFGEAKGRHGTDKVLLNADTWAVGVIGQIPVTERFTVFGKAGYHFWEYKARLQSPLPWREHKDGGDPYVGAGVRVYFTRHLFLLGEYEAYRVHRFDYDNVNLGLGWKF